MIILGLSGLPHAHDHHLRTHPHASEIDRRICQGLDSAACLIINGEIRAAAAEERFSGAKGAGGLPVSAIEYCLDQAGITCDDVDVIAHGFDYYRYRRFFAHIPDHFEQVLSGHTVMAALTDHGWCDVASRFRPVQHHLAHAASAFYPSGFDSALSIVSDGIGEIDSLSVHRCAPGNFESLHTQQLDTSLGLLYSVFTRFLGYAPNSDEYKVMGLSAYGDADKFMSFFDGFLRNDGGAVIVDWPLGALESGAEGYPHAMEFLASELGVPGRAQDEEMSSVHADIAAALQQRFSTVLTELARFWLSHTGADALCLSGGTFLNCLANESIARLPQVRRLFIPPAAGDDGTAIGAALHVAGELNRTFTPYTGPRYQAGEVSSVLERAPVRWQHHGFTDSYFDLAARDLAEDRIIAWFEGRMEFGPRALGNRSILALPNGHDIKDRLNRAVKLRESYRPFAPAVLDIDYSELFEGEPLDPCRFMLCTARVRREQAHRIAGAVHVDGSARVQIVRRTDNEMFWRLLWRVRELTGIGCVINTSFNVKDQPIIMTPELAVDGLLTMSLDRLYIEGFRVAGSDLSDRSQRQPTQ
ncbi:carbamoyltransferase C-terminal domain-containing protein [Nocardia sp. NPDC051911]|uniref:carbamoyltransferase family protein n=1 Tax=Nocardia sp. NPDC051911 TaxID=3154648 RepID=UPI00341B5708